MPVTAPARSPERSSRRQSFLTADTSPDATLVALAARGDERAFEILFQRHRTDVLAYATRMLRDHGRAEDVVQDVFVSAMRAIAGAERSAQPVHVRAWLREIARRACIDQWRGSKRRGEVSLDAPDRLRPADAHRLADDDSLARTTDGREAVATLRLAFGDLPELQHSVLVQRELEGRSIAEIADRLEITPTVVEGQLSRGRRALGQAYKELESGQRCVAVRALCDTSVSDRLGVRDRHRVGRHVQGCDGCRRYARAAGVDSRLIDRGVLQRASLLLPLPLLRRLPMEHAAAGEAAGSVLGAKVLVGAAVIAAGGGGVYATSAVTPAVPVAPVSPETRATDAAISRFGMQSGLPGQGVVRIPGVTARTGTSTPTVGVPRDPAGRPLFVTPAASTRGTAVLPGVAVPATVAPQVTAPEDDATSVPAPEGSATAVLPPAQGATPLPSRGGSGTPTRSIPLAPAPTSGSSDDGPATPADDSPDSAAGGSQGSPGAAAPSDDLPTTAAADVATPTPVTPAADAPAPVAPAADAPAPVVPSDAAPSVPAAAPETDAPATTPAATSPAAADAGAVVVD